SKNMLLLEERDLHFFRDGSENTGRYQLDVPRIKKRQNYRDTRRRNISLKLGGLLERLVDSNRKRFGGPDPKRAILCQTQPRKRGDAFGKRFANHLTSAGICNLVNRYAKQTNLFSDWTGELLHLTPRRLRYTYATRMAEQGAPPAVLADLLDH